MLSKKTIVLTTLAAAAATVLVVTQGAWTHDEPNKLEGAWVVKVPGYPIQYSLVMSPSDASRRSAISGSLQVRIPVELLAPVPFPEFDPGISSAFIGEALMTGHNKAKFTLVGYALNKVAPTLESPFTEKVAFTWVASGQLKFAGVGSFESTAEIAYYLPEADGDGDGFPDADATPLFRLPASTSLGTRVGQALPSTP